MQFRKNENNQIVLNKKASIQLAEKDKFLYSPANKLIFVVTPLETSFTVTAYDLKGVSKGSYEYKNAEFDKFCLRQGYANIVYCQNEKNGNRAWYQGKLVETGYMTDLYALHRTNIDSIPIAMVDEDTDSGMEIDKAEIKASALTEKASHINLTKQEKDDKVSDILAELTPKEAAVLGIEQGENTAEQKSI